MRSLAIPLKQSLLDQSLKVFSFFLISGNLLRFNGFGFTVHGFLLTEFLLYFCIFCCLFVFRFTFSRSFLLVLMTIAVSTLYGSYINGIHFNSMFYAVRLMMMIIVGVVIGKVLYLKFGDSIVSLLIYFQKIYFKTILLGFVIYVFFFDASKIWPFFALFGLGFNGDSHMGRYVSPYLCPNLYGAIAPLPFLISFHVTKYTKQNLLKVFLFGFSILLTWSRSGIAGFILVVSTFCLFSCKKTYVSIKKKYLWYLVAALFAIACVFVYSFDEVSYFWRRFIHMKSCDSALGRLDTFLMGLDILKDHPLLGVGYNFIGMHLVRYSGPSMIDSSLLATVVAFGILASSSLLVAAVVWFSNFYSKILRLKKRSAEAFELFRFLAVYTCVTMIFTCHFVNVLYYPFWFMPVLSLFTYLSEFVKNQEKFTS